LGVKERKVPLLAAAERVARTAVLGSVLSVSAVALVIALLSSLTGCSRIGKDEVLMDELVQMEEGGYEQKEVSVRRIEEIEGNIQRYRKEVKRTVEANGQLGIYYKMLAVEYMRAGMFGVAYEALQQAIAIHPENPILFYYSAVCAARMSKAQVILEDRQSWLEVSERLYHRAIALDPGYAAALYGLGILYVFELDRPEEAEGVLEELLLVESKNIDGRFLLARVYYSLGKLEETIQLYKEIESLSDVKEKRREAADRRVQIEDELYGAE
jgi:tetratricopeptide (TPR) repeat protein